MKVIMKGMRSEFSQRRVIEVDGYSCPVEFNQKNYDLSVSMLQSINDRTEKEMWTWKKENYYEIQVDGLYFYGIIDVMKEFPYEKGDVLLCRQASQFEKDVLDMNYFYMVIPQKTLFRYWYQRKINGISELWADSTSDGMLYVNSMGKGQKVIFPEVIPGLRNRYCPESVAFYEWAEENGLWSSLYCSTETLEKLYPGFKLDSM